MSNVGRFIFFSLLVATLLVSSWLRSRPPQFVGTERFAPVPTSTTFYSKPIEIPPPIVQIEPIPGPVLEIEPIRVPQYHISPVQIPQYRVDPYITTPRVVEPIRAPEITSIPRYSSPSHTASSPVSGGITGVNPRAREEAKLSAEEARVHGEITELTGKKAGLEAKKQALEELEQKKIKLDVKKRELKDLERQARKKGVRP